MRMKRSVAMLLCALMVGMLCVTALPNSAKAVADHVIQVGTDGIGADDKIYFGKYTESGTEYDVPWYVLSKDATANSAFLLSEYLLGNWQFREADTKFYKDSMLNVRMDDLYNGTNTLFTLYERSAIANVAELECVDPRGTVAPPVQDAHLYPLSIDEATSDIMNSTDRNVQYINNPQDASSRWWWSRSFHFDPGRPDIGNPAKYIVWCRVGSASIGAGVTDNWGVRPAMNLGLSKVLFAAAADNSGQSATFSTPAAYSGKNWKLTIKDGNSFAAGTAKTGGNTALTTGYAAEALTFRHAKLSSFTGAGYTNVTAALTNAAGDLLYYGSINTGADATSSTVTIPTGLAVGNYTLSLYAEDRNAANTTDYATGTPFTQTITVTTPTITFTENPANKTVTAGAIAASDTLTASASVSPAGTATLNWFACSSAGVPSGTSLGTGGTFQIPTTLTAGGTYYYLCQASYTGAVSVNSTVATVTVNAAPVPSASIGDATVSGTTGTAITPVDAALTLTNAQFQALAADADISGWFTNLPAGLSAKIKQAVAANATTATVTFSGTPTATSTAAMAVTIPAASLVGNAALAVTANANAKWAIASPPPPGPIITDPAADRTVPVTVGNPVTLSVTAVNTTGYQWWINRGAGFEIIPGATGASYVTAPVTPANNGYQYYCVVTGNGGSVTSPVFTLNVTEPIDVPATGDNAMPGLWIGLALMAGAALTVNTMLYRRKRRSN